MKNKKKVMKRVQFEFSEESIDRLDGMIKKTESASRAEVLRRSLKLYDYVVEKVLEGYSLEMVKDNDETIRAKILVA